MLCDLPLIMVVYVCAEGLRRRRLSPSMGSGGMKKGRHKACLNQSTYAPRVLGKLGRRPFNPIVYPASLAGAPSIPSCTPPAWPAPLGAFPDRQTIFFLFFTGAFGNTPRLKAGEGVSSENFLQLNAFERISSEKFLQPNAFERISSEKFLQLNAFERIYSEKFLQKRVVGENYSRKFLQKKAVGENYSRKYLQKKAVGENYSRKRLQKKAAGENYSRKCLQLMLVGRVVYNITGLHSKFHRNDTLLQSHQAPPDELLSGDDECQNPVTTTAMTYISRRTKVLLLPIVLLYGHPLWGAFFYSIGRMRLRPNETILTHTPRVYPANLSGTPSIPSCTRPAWPAPLGAFPALG